MNAWVIERHGGPEVLLRKQVEQPQPGPGEVRVRVRAVGLNHLDLWVRKGVPGHSFPLPLIPGCDVVGEVDLLGPLSESKSASMKRAGLEPGRVVLVNPVLSCGHCKSCLSASPQTCPEFGILGETRDGGCAEFVVVPAENLIALPETLDPIKAAALPIAYITAWTMLMTKARVRPGETVLIQAGGSGVSTAAIQIAKSQGAKVITTVGDQEKAKRAKELGADQVIDYRTGSFRDEVRRIMKSAGRRGVDVVIEHVGGNTFQESLKCLDWGGRIVTCGATTGSKVEIDLKPVFFKNISILGATMGSKADLIRVTDLAVDGVLNPVLDSTFPMERLPEAFERIETRKAFGKVVVTRD